MVVKNWNKTIAEALSVLKKNSEGMRLVSLKLPSTGYVIPFVEEGVSITPLGDESVEVLVGDEVFNVAKDGVVYGIKVWTKDVYAVRDAVFEGCFWKDHGLTPKQAWAIFNQAVLQFLLEEGGLK